MPTRDNVHKKVQGLLRKLRSSGVKVVFEVEEGFVSKGVRVALRGQDVYIAALEPEQRGLCFNYQEVCEQGGPKIKAMCSTRNPTVTLDDQTFYHAYRSYPDSVPIDVFSMLQKGHEFPADYMKKLNSGV